MNSIAPNSKHPPAHLLGAQSRGLRALIVFLRASMIVCYVAFATVILRFFGVQWPYTVVLGVVIALPIILSLTGFGVLGEHEPTAKESAWQLLAIIGCLTVGAIIGAFVFAPFRWPDHTDFFAMRCFGAFLGVVAGIWSTPWLIFVVDIVQHVFKGRSPTPNAR